MKKILFFAIIAITLIASCDDTTDGLGSSLTNASDKVAFATAEFNLVTDTKQGDNICSNSSYAYLGKIQDPETGSYITANYMTQLRLQPYYVPFTGIDSLIVVDQKSGDTLRYAKELTEAERDAKRWQVKADSCFLTLYFNKFTGDSTTQMKVAVHEMTKYFDDSKDYPISFDPIKEGYIRNEKGSIHAQRTYAITSDNTTNGSHYITIPMNEPYTNKITETKDSTFNNFGSYLMYQYYNENAIYHKGFNNPTFFLKYLCPGFYIEHVAGKAAICNISATTLSTYYKTQYINKGYPYISTNAFSGTEESVQHSTITETEFLSTLPAEEKEKYTFLKSPVGIYTSIKIDVDSIMKGHDNQKISTARIFLPCVNNESTSSFVQSAPSTVLLLRADSINTFFDKRQLMDYSTSYITTYNSSTNGYVFDNISSLVKKMYDEWQNSGSGLTLSEYEAKYPNWNTIYIVPVETEKATISTSTIYTHVSHAMDLQGIRLLRGTKENNKVRISIIYSKDAESD